jgi:hypothetical protein
MGTDPAYPFQQIKILDPGSFLACFLNPTMNIAEPHGSAGDDLSIYSKLKMPWLL